MTALTYIQSHLLPQQTVPLVTESEVVCVVVVVVVGGIIIFTAINSSLIHSWGHPTAWRREWQNKRGRWENHKSVGGETKAKNQKIKRREDGQWWMIFPPSKSLKTEKHSDTPAPRITRRPSFGSSPPLKSGRGSSQQMLHVPHFTHALCVFDGCQNRCKARPHEHTDTTVRAQKKGREANKLNDDIHTEIHDYRHWNDTSKNINRAKISHFL